MLLHFWLSFIYLDSNLLLVHNSFVHVYESVRSQAVQLMTCSGSNLINTQFFYNKTLTVQTILAYSTKRADVNRHMP